MGALSFTSTAVTSALRGLQHTTDLIRATSLEVTILAGHLLLYPTGVLQERLGEEYAKRVMPQQQDGSPQSSPTSRRVHAAADGIHPPVLLLHGFVDNRSVFAVLRRSLRRSGWEHVQAINYSPLTSDIRRAAEMLGRHVEQVCEQSGHRRLDIVGHSLGGLIARYYVQRLGGDARVRTVVTLAAPHSGTRAVPLASTHPIVRQMRPNSELIAELALPAPGCSTRFVAFWSGVDQLMVPVESARLEHSDLISQNIEVRGIGHLAMPVNGAVATAVRQALQGGAPAASTVDAA
ncbi:alpha/beta fold hydrolase [Streptomyces sp. RB6PN25]|uniref:Alpha/beta fold hydrolase n=1 Tax=Streptomyces humicola TaxID=2953240 RepID=A0ABT1PY36_9ACTN|nr:alpha/beta fold hydrolase [Streptomyces humicola]MCQ4082591.1 alpha/beta fold hydrolase [Streptomyces humicola]